MGYANVITALEQYFRGRLGGKEVWGKRVQNVVSEKRCDWEFALPIVV